MLKKIKERKAKLNIIITLDCKKYNQKEFDIKVNDEQIIYECLRIVNESLNINLPIEDINYCRSLREKKMITIYGTFKENNICTGDILALN